MNGKCYGFSMKCRLNGSASVVISYRTLTLLFALYILSDFLLKLKSFPLNQYALCSGRISTTEPTVSVAEPCHFA
jgi:hypothetical protein